MSEIRTFVVIASIGLPLTTVLAEIFRETFAAHAAETIAHFAGGYVPPTDLVAHAGAIAAVAVYSFLGHKWCTFGRGIRPFLSDLVRPKGNLSSTWTDGVDKAAPK
jgi:hypothetical protein